MHVTRALPFIAAVLTPPAGLAILVPRSFVATRCFRTPTFGGCASSQETFASMLARAPEQIAPHLAVLVLLTVISIVIGFALIEGGPAHVTAAFGIGVYAFLIAGASIALGPYLVLPLVLLVASLAAALGASTRDAARIVAEILVLVGGAFAVAYLFAQAWATRLGAFPGGGFDTFWLYVALASAAALALGAGLATRRRHAGDLARGVVLGYLAFGLAGAAVALGSLPILYPRGTYVPQGLAVLWSSLEWLTLTNMVFGTLVLRIATGARWRASLAIGTVMTLAVLFTGIGTAMAFGPLAVSGVAPPLLFLPNTSTAP